MSAAFAFFLGNAFEMSDYKKNGLPQCVEQSLSSFKMAYFLKSNGAQKLT